MPPSKLTTIVLIFTIVVMVLTSTCTANTFLKQIYRVGLLDKANRYFTYNTISNLTNVYNIISQREPRYAIIVDAGSTGSRASAYEFQQKQNDDFQLIKSKEFQVKPGLSGYLNNPNEAVRSISHLLDNVKTVIPRAYWDNTEIQLRATAGLRALEADKSQKILNNLNVLFENHDFKTNVYGSVDIMDGDDEAAFSWFAVNILQKRLDGNLNDTSAVIELGGGSAQVSYIPTKQNDEECTKNYKIKGNSIDLFTKCYEKMGLMSGRQGTYTKQNGDKLHYSSPCLHKEAINVEYTFGPSAFHVSGEENDYGIDFEKCKETIERYIKYLNVKPPKDLQNQNITIISFFFDLAKDAGLIEQPQGKITINSYYEAARKECKKKYTKSNAFKCLDLLYIAVFLEKGLGLNRSTVMDLVKSVDGHRINWALGAAYNLIKPEQQTISDDNVSIDRSYT